MTSFSSVVFNRGLSPLMRGCLCQRLKALESQISAEAFKAVTKVLFGRLNSHTQAIANAHSPVLQRVTR